jgi:uncharacterized protein DUF3313
MRKGSSRNHAGAALVALGVALLVGAAGCSNTVESTPEAAKAVETGSTLPAGVTSFMGQYASKLQPGPAGGPALVWIYPDAKWINYRKVILMPVEFWAAADSKVPTNEQQVLTAYFYNALKTNLEQNYTLTDQPGPGTLKLRVALMDATASVPGLRSVSVLVPQARVLNMAQSLATGSYAFVGSAEAEMQVTDSETGDVFAEAVDQRAGGMGLKGAESFQWGDAQNAMDYWAQLISKRLLQLQTGAAQ